MAFRVLSSGNDTITPTSFPPSTVDADTIISGSGNDLIDGGGGNDWVGYWNATGGVLADLSTGRSSGAAGNDTFISIEALEGGSYADTLIGGGANDSLSGNYGNDSLFGADGDDWLDGGINDDILVGGLGDDTLIGGYHRDIVDYRAASGGVTININAVNTSFAPPQTVGRSSGAAGNDSLFGIDIVIGSNHADSLAAGTGLGFEAMVLSGAGGNDTITGGASYSTLAGGDGDDRIVGGFAQYASGDDGHDTLQAGYESASGGQGDDSLVASFRG